MTLSTVTPKLFQPKALLCAAVLLASVTLGPVSWAADDFSAAERALFMDNQLGALKPPVTLQFSYRKSGTLEAAFDDTVAVTLRNPAQGPCCNASAEFLHGDRQLKLPDIESAQGNPAVLYFLERDIREMQRLTKGQPNYFRKRIRMAVAQGATLRPVQVAWAGKPVDGQEITLTPYLDDPLRARFEQLAAKQYVFTLSAAVPGGVHSIRTQVAGAMPGSPPVLVEEMALLGAVPAAALTVKTAGKVAAAVAKSRQQP